MISDKNILILDGSITTGETLSRAIESILYYGGAIRGIASIFSAATSIAGLPVYSILTIRIFRIMVLIAATCPLCAQKQKLDALVNGFGYSKSNL